MRKFVISLIFMLVVSTVFAQNKTGKAKIYGVVKSKIEVLPYATVVLKSTENKLIEGVVTDENGKFTIDKILNGKYILEAQYIGFITSKKELTITSNKRSYNLENIILTEDTAKLDEVVVQANTSEVNLKLGKKVFRVGKDITAQSGSAIDVLGNVPSVNVSPSGGISLRGNSNVQIMINGRRSALTQSQALEQLSSDLVERIEVITNPSASYDASGSSGIINIILKKDRKSGLNGQLQLRVGTPDDYRAYGNVNYKSNSFNFFGNAGIRYTDYKGDYSQTQEIDNNGITTIINQIEDENRHDDGQLFYFGSDYYINDKNTITVAFYRNETEDTDTTKLDYAIETNGNLATQITNGNSKEKRNYNQLEGNYTKIFSKEGRKFTVDFQYDFWNSNKKWNLVNNQVLPVSSPNFSIQTEGVGKTNDFKIQSDFKTPISKSGVLEIGGKLENRTIFNDFLASELVNGSYQTIQGFDNSLEYKEQILAGYAQFNTKKNKFSYQFGLRLEATDVQIIASDANKSSENKYVNLFPSATIGYEVSDKSSAQISYSRRINRPSLWYLSPFYELKDYTSRTTGNPNLKPAFTNAFELSFLVRQSKLQLNPSIYYNTSKDVMEFQTVRTSDDTFVSSPINLDEEQRFGLELGTSYRFAKWFQLSSDFNFFKFRQKGTINSVYSNFSNQNWSLNLTANIKPSKTLRLQTRFFYRGRNANAQTLVKPIHYVNIGLSKSVFNNKGSISFNASNIFDTRKTEYNIVGDNYNINSINSRNGARYALGFSYKFNQTKSDRNRRAKRSNRF